MDKRIDEINKKRRAIFVRKKEIRNSSPKLREIDRKKVEIRQSYLFDKGIKPTSYNYGYMRNGLQEYLPVSAEAEIVRFFFNSYLQFRSIRKVIKAAEQRGFVTRKGKKWSVKSVYNILVNPTYVGKILWKGQIKQGSYSPLIEQTLFDSVNQLLKNN